MSQTTTWTADPLSWGHGPRLFEMFLEPTCPYSVRAYGKLNETLALAGADQGAILIGGIIVFVSMIVGISVMISGAVILREHRHNRRIDRAMGRENHRDAATCRVVRDAAP